MVALKASDYGQLKIKQARKSKGWTIDDFRWLEAASSILGVSWQQEGYLADGISEGTWKRFLAGKYAINVDAFKAYCQILGLEWQEIVGRNNYQDWGEQIDVSVFFGRTKELDLINQWIIKEKCRLITLLGMGGIGKTALAIKAAQLMTNKFEFIIWRSLRNAPPLETLLGDLIQFLSQQNNNTLPVSLALKISLLLKYLQNSRCLLILDNAESIINNNPDNLAISPQNSLISDKYNYSQLFKAIAETQHQSCLILTSREKIAELEPLEGDSSPVKCLQLKGLSTNDGQEILRSQPSVLGSAKEFKTLVNYYGGNPLALEVVAVTIQDFFAGRLADFIAVLLKDSFVFDDINNLLQQQFSRLTCLQQQIMYWLAVNREPISLQDLQQDLVFKVSPQKLLPALASLKKRSLIEKNANMFNQQTVVMEYVTSELINRIVEEVKTQEINIFNQVAIVKYQTKDYLVKSQEAQILQPLITKLVNLFSGSKNLIKHLNIIIECLRNFGDEKQKIGYLSGNIINILNLLKVDLSNYDFSGLAVWQAKFQGIKLHNVNFADADLSKSTFTATLGNVLGAAFSPDGKTIATCDTDCQIRLWQTTTGKLLVICKGHNNWVRSVAFSPDGQTLISGSGDRTVKFWQVSDGTCIKTCRGHESEIFSVAYSPNGLIIASASGDNIIRIWDTLAAKCIGIYQGHTNSIRSVAFSPDGQTLASGSDDCTVRIWDVKTEKCLQTLEGHHGWIRSVAFSPDGSILASGSGDRTIKLWSVSSVNVTTFGKCLDTYDLHSGDVSAVAFSPDGITLASGSCDRTVRLWHYHTHTCIKTIYGHANQIFSLAFSPQGKTVVCVSLDQTVRIWDCVNGRCLKTWQGNSDWVFPVAFSPEGNLVASGSNDCTVRIWNWKKNNCIQVLSGHQDLVCAVAFHPDGKTLASASRDNTIRLWNLHTGKCSQILAGHEDWIYSVAFSPNGKILASGGADKTVKLWDYPAGNCQQTLTGHSDQVWSVAFSPDSQTIASSGTDQKIRLWNVVTGECGQTLTGHSNRITSLAFSPRDRHLLASGSTDQTIILWDIQQGKSLKTLTGHDNWVFSVEISPDGQTIASASHDGTIRLWNPIAEECLHICSGHQHLVSAVAFHPQGKILASGSQDQTVRLWDVNQGKCLRVLQVARLYEGMNIASAKGLTPAQKITLKTLGATD